MMTKNQINEWEQLVSDNHLVRKLNAAMDFHLYNSKKTIFTTWTDQVLFLFFI